MRFNLSIQEFGHYLLLLIYRMNEEKLFDEEVAETVIRLANFKPLLKAFYVDHPEFLPHLKMMMQTLKGGSSALLLHVMTDPDVFVAKSGRYRKILNRILKREGIMVKDREFLQILADADIIYEPKLVEKYLNKGL